MVVAGVPSFVKTSAGQSLMAVDFTIDEITLFGQAIALAMGWHFAALLTVFPLHAVYKLVRSFAGGVSGGSSPL